MRGAADKALRMKHSGPIYFGGFEVLDIIGHGGMATVVRARSPRGSGLPPQVALKFLHRELTTDPDSIVAFTHEAFMGMRCVHPGLCRTFALEVERGRSALVMEYLCGTSLSALRQRLSEQHTLIESQMAVAIIASQIAGALHALHEVRDDQGGWVGAVHRDVTPQNIIVTPSGESKLFDYGVAFSAEKGADTAQGIVKGKLSYLSPEYLAGKPWDRQLDVWSLGVVLWELLTGLRLFHGQTPAERLSKVLSFTAPQPSELRPSIDPRLDAIVGRAIQREPRQRYSSASELEQDLWCFVQSKGVDRPSEHLATWMKTMGVERVSGIRDKTGECEGQPAYKFG